MSLREKLGSFDCLEYEVSKTKYPKSRYWVAHVYVNFHFYSLNVEESLSFIQELYRVLVADERNRPFYPFEWCIQLDSTEYGKGDCEQGYYFEFTFRPPKHLPKLISYLKELWKLPIFSKKELDKLFDKKFHMEGSMKNARILFEEIKKVKTFVS